MALTDLLESSQNKPQLAPGTIPALLVLALISNVVEVSLLGEECTLVWTQTSGLLL